MTAMTVPEHRFVTRWSVLGTVEEVAVVLADLREFARWWPSVFLDVEELEPGAEDGVGRRARLHTKAWFPYTLYLQFRVVESRHPYGFSISATGDLEGRGDWTLEEAGAWTLVTHDCRVRVETPLLRLLSPVLRPVLAANHRWAMRMGEESLALELARRRVATAVERAKVPPPPPPVPAGPFLAAGAAAAAAAAYLVARGISRRRRRRRRLRWLRR
jgi:hypothetical protein